MMKFKFGCLALACVLAAGILFPHASGQRRRASGRPQAARICPDPTLPCRTSVTFEPYQLPFRIPENAVIWETEQFYAVILKSVRADDVSDCESFVPEAERLAAQDLFPRRKVFASRCFEPGDLYYTGTAENQRFMAVYAGLTRAEAQRTLALVRATGQYAGANLRRMRAGFNGT
jgi:hypothetical protein